MASRAFDEETIPTGFEDFQFKIRGWPAHKNEDHFNIFMQKIDGNLQLMAELEKDQNGITFVSKDRLSDSGVSGLEEANFEKDPAQTTLRSET
jgi:hypothetical protein